MKKCPHCAEEIQDEAIKCRFCGESLTRAPKVAPTTTPKKTTPLILLFSLVMGGIVLIVVVLNMASGVSGGRVAALPDLSARVRASGLMVELQNDDSAAWTNVDITVNTDRVGYGGYKCEHQSYIAAGEKVEVPLASCATRDGARFTPLTMKAVNARVDAQARSGESRRTFFGTFR